MHIILIDRIHPSLKNGLEAAGHYCKEAYNIKKSDIENIIHKYEGIFIRSRFILDENFIKKARKLRFIGRAGSGLENIDVTFAKSKNIECFNASEGNKQAVAEHALAMILCLFNKLNRADKEVREGIWEREKNRGIEMSGKTVAIIGYGNNGSAFAKLLQGFQVRILAYDKYLSNYPYQSSMEEIYNEADIISLHIPLTEETKYLVNHNFINQFKKNLYLINISRGKCVEIRSVVDHLKNGKLLGACLDVLESEEISFNDVNRDILNNDMNYILNSNKTILSPHIAGWTLESNIKIAEVLLEKVTIFAKENTNL